jgi:hypothetical protein
MPSENSNLNAINHGEDRRTEEDAGLRSAPSSLVSRCGQHVEAERHEEKAKDNGVREGYSHEKSDIDDKCKHSPEWIRSKFPDYDHYNPNKRGLCIIMAIYVTIFSAIAAVICVCDQCVPGFRIVLTGNLLYFVVYRGIRLFFEVEWLIQSTSASGIQFQVFVAFVKLMNIFLCPSSGNSFFKMPTSHVAA